MTTFKIPTREEVSPVSQAAFDALHKALGMVPNLYAAIAWSDNGLHKYLAYQGAKTSLSNKEKEIVNLVVSQVNGCKYCLSAHTVLGKMNGLSDDEIMKIRKGSSSDQKLNALVVLTRDITEHKGRVSPENLDLFFDAGYTKGSLVDVILQVSDKVAMNYLHNLTEVPIDFPLAPALT
ncbi:MAG TPA: carboxymuconolactone decarboxylase family protein [Puia sp.]|nr:carboxymuconolactone decarboxylase family protein [Puia sp.]